ncbi:phage distal tail protein, Rcc01695 family [Paenirhodobacter enshiensis]|uniref:phage distal tail protein, Rcc01695 family n=1 Tax=Paenirhodobacter enshiensis TaxID=1105367 RepID=UPI0035B38ADE
MAFHEIRFPANLSFGSVGGPERRTEIVTLSNGYEERNSPWAQSRHSYDAGVGLRSLDDVERLIAFFEARGGRLHGFRWKDWADYKSCPASRTVAYDDQIIGTGDGVRTEFALAKTYASGGHSYVRAITKPVEGTVLTGIQGHARAEAVHFEVDLTTGIVRFYDPPAEGALITAGFEFDVPVRFDTEGIQVSVQSFRAGDLPQVPVVEVRI